jgi:tRNA dimethylallyltransferase
MIDMGFVDEVRRLHESKSLGRNAREALGYKQIIEHLEGRCSLEEAVEQMKIRTRRYAKQQRTWLRRFKFHPNSIWFDAANLTPDELAERARQAIMNTELHTTREPTTWH